MLSRSFAFQRAAHPAPPTPIVPPNVLDEDDGEPIEPEDVVVLCFLVVGDIALAPWWEPWFQHPQIEVVVHSKNPSALSPVYKPYLASKIHPTKRSHPSIVVAMAQLCADALRRFPEASHVQFVSESCAPIAPPDEYLDSLSRHRSYLRFNKADETRRSMFWRRHRRALFSSSQWSCLCRRHAAAFARDVHIALGELSHMPDNAVADEIAIPTWFAHRPIAGADIVHKQITFTLWPREHTGHPIAFKDVDETLVRRARERSCFILRKLDLTARDWSTHPMRRLAEAST